MGRVVFTAHEAAQRCACAPGAPSKGPWAREGTPVWLECHSSAIQGGAYGPCRWARLEAGAGAPAADSETHKMVMNIGKRPTFGDEGGWDGVGRRRWGCGVRPHPLRHGWALAAGHAFSSPCLPLSSLRRNLPLRSRCARPAVHFSHFTAAMPQSLPLPAALTQSRLCARLPLSTTPPTTHPPIAPPMQSPAPAWSCTSCTSTPRTFMASSCGRWHSATSGV